MKKLLVTLAAAVASGYATYFVVRGLFIMLLWMLDYELTVSQRIFVVENGYFAFIVGFIMGITLFLRLNKRFELNKI